MLRKTITIMMLAAVCLCVGCDSNSNNKMTAKTKWQQLTTQIKLDLAEQQIDSSH